MGLTMVITSDKRGRVVFYSGFIVEIDGEDDYVYGDGRKERRQQNEKY